MNNPSKSSPESPAKEQPGEQNVPFDMLAELKERMAAAPDVVAMVKRLRAQQTRIWNTDHELNTARRLIAEAAAMIEKLRQGWIPVSGYAEARARFGGEGVKTDRHSNAFAYFVDSKTQWFAVALPPPPERP